MSTSDKIAALSAWIDGSYSSEMDPELRMRRRVDKIMEEAGEVGAAVGGVWGENPRKGVTHTTEDVLAELLDVAITALGAYESITGNVGASGPALAAKIDAILERAGIRQISAVEMEPFAMGPDSAPDATMWINAFRIVRPNEETLRAIGSDLVSMLAIPGSTVIRVSAT